MNDLELEKLKLIEDDKIKKQEIRKIALSESISNLSQIENNFDERDARI